MRPMGSAPHLPKECDHLFGRDASRMITLLGQAWQRLPMIEQPLNMSLPLTTPALCLSSPLTHAEAPSNSCAGKLLWSMQSIWHVKAEKSSTSHSISTEKIAFCFDVCCANPWVIFAQLVAQGLMCPKGSLSPTPDQQNSQGNP